MSSDFNSISDISFSLTSFPSDKEQDSLNISNVRLYSSRNGLYVRFVKRSFDVVCSLVALCILFPLLLFLTFFLFISLRGNPFFIQTRIGRYLVPFGIIKFRTMTDERDDNGELLPDEKRTTRLGAILRSTSLDELPELFNVLLGHMSLIGPRPWIPEVMAIFPISIQRKRMLVRPGLSGLAQVLGRNHIEYSKRICYDLIYQRRMSFLFDMKLFFFTFYKVFKQEGIQYRSDEFSYREKGEITK